MICFCYDRTARKKEKAINKFLDQNIFKVAWTGTGALFRMRREFPGIPMKFSDYKFKSISRPKSVHKRTTNTFHREALLLDGGRLTGAGWRRSPEGSPEGSLVPGQGAELPLIQGVPADDRQLQLSEV